MLSTCEVRKPLKFKVDNLQEKCYPQACFQGRRGWGPVPIRTCPRQAETPEWEGNSFQMPVIELCRVTVQGPEAESIEPEGFPKPTLVGTNIKQWILPVLKAELLRCYLMLNLQGRPFRVIFESWD